MSSADGLSDCFKKHIYSSVGCTHVLEEKTCRLDFSEEVGNKHNDYSVSHSKLQMLIAQKQLFVPVWELNLQLLESSLAVFLRVFRCWGSEGAALQPTC